MDTDIGDSVGDAKKGAINRTKDVETVQGLLNVQIVKDRGSDRFVAVDGRVGSETLAALAKFQGGHSLALTGLMKRGDATIRALAHFNEPRGMRASRAGIDLIKGYEQFRSHPYDNDGSAGNTTIGWGHLLHSGRINHSSSEKKFENGITKTEAENLLRTDLGTVEREVNSCADVPVTQAQFDALVSLAFNLGPSGFNGSTLLTLLNRGDYLGAAKHFEDFHYAHHKAVSGLADRRRREKDLFSRR